MTVQKNEHPAGAFSLIKLAAMTLLCEKARCSGCLAEGLIRVIRSLDNGLKRGSVYVSSNCAKTARNDIEHAKRKQKKQSEKSAERKQK